MEAVSTTGLSHRFGDRTALDAVTLSVPEGSLVSLLGPNGSGKTTLFRLLSTVLPHQEGEILIFGEDPRAAAATVRSMIATVFQSPSLDGELTVTENLQVFAALYGVSKPGPRILEVLDLVDLSDRRKDRVARLSGGLRRRVDLARGLLHAPRLLLLDEPTTGLDPTARDAFWDAVNHIRDTQGVTVLAATHLLDEAAESDRVAILDQGVLVAHDAPAALTSALGDEMLWVDTSDPDAVRSAVPEGRTVHEHGKGLVISGDGLDAILLRLRDTCGDAVEGLTLRRPDLSDVFAHATGRDWSAADSGVTA